MEQQFPWGGPLQLLQRLQPTLYGLILVVNIVILPPTDFGLWIFLRGAVFRRHIDHYPLATVPGSIRIFVVFRCFPLLLLPFYSL